MYNDAMSLPSKPNLATQVRDMLFHLGFGGAWYAQNVGDIEAFVYLFRKWVYIISNKIGVARWMIHPAQ